MEKPLDKVISEIYKLVPKDDTVKGFVFILMSLFMAFMSFSVGTIMATFFIVIAILNSCYGQWLIVHDRNKHAE